MNLFENDPPAPGKHTRAPEVNPLSFFEVAKPHSILKADIVSKYILAWANIIVRGNLHFKKDARAYVVDLFCGCGQYKDGTKSTPLKVIEGALANQQLKQNLLLRFNDAEPLMISRLQDYISAVQGSNEFSYPIKYTTLDAESAEVASWFTRNASGPRVPMLVFIDPFGYKQISQELLRSIIQVPQSDIIFFFNYKRVNAALDNELFESNMNKIFGDVRVQTIKGELDKAKPAERSDIIIRHLKESLMEIGAKYVTPFVVVQDDEEHISHYIVGITKHEKGYELLKKIMKQHSQQGARAKSKFGHDLASIRREQQNSLFNDLPDPIGDLAKQLALEFKGRTLTFGQLYSKHHPTTEFTESEYKQAIRRLLKDQIVYPADDAPLSTRRTANGEQAIPDHSKIRFV